MRTFEPINDTCAATTQVFLVESFVWVRINVPQCTWHLDEKMCRRNPVIFFGPFTGRSFPDKYNVWIRSQGTSRSTGGGVLEVDLECLLLVGIQMFKMLVLVPRYYTATSMFAHINVHHDEVPGSESPWRSQNLKYSQLIDLSCGLQVLTHWHQLYVLVVLVVALRLACQLVCQWRIWRHRKLEGFNHGTIHDIAERSSM